MQADSFERFRVRSNPWYHSDRFYLVLVRNDRTIQRRGTVPRNRNEESDTVWSLGIRFQPELVVLLGVVDKWSCDDTQCNYQRGNKDIPQGFRAGQVLPHNRTIWGTSFSLTFIIHFDVSINRSLFQLLYFILISTTDITIRNSSWKLPVIQCFLCSTGIELLRHIEWRLQTLTYMSAKKVARHGWKLAIFVRSKKVLFWKENI